MSTPTSQKPVAIYFTEEEAQVTLRLFDAAVKSVGLNAAEAVAVLAKKINTAFEETKKNVVPELS